MDTYNGWENYETWNAALYISNDAGLYELAREVEKYDSLVEILREAGSTETPDQVAWNDSGINRDELDEMIAEWNAS